MYIIVPDVLEKAKEKSGMENPHTRQTDLIRISEIIIQTQFTPPAPQPPSYSFIPSTYTRMPACLIFHFIFL